MSQPIDPDPRGVEEIGRVRRPASMQGGMAAHYPLPPPLNAEELERASAGLNTPQRSETDRSPTIPRDGQ
jgi:hypothetical protein